MTILVHEIHENLTDTFDLLDKFRTFAVARGWTSAEYQQDMVWSFNGGWGWNLPSTPGEGETYLRLQSSGYGGQTLDYKLRMENSPGTDPHDWLQIGASLNEPHQAINAHPVSQDNWNLYRYHSFSSEQILKSWFFGNDKYLLIVAQLSTDYIVTLQMGSAELDDPSESEGMLAHWHTSLNNPTFYWTTKNGLLTSDKQGNFLYYNGGRVVSINDAGYNFVFNGNDQKVNGLFSSYAETLQANDFSNERPQSKQILYVKDNATTRYKKIGTSWVYRRDNKGFAIGETYTLGGTRRFIAFPNGLINDREKGFAVEIAY
jgi:hypothetical protein